jgi:alginate O-acetyltransferase complex protein AlgI
MVFNSIEFILLYVPITLALLYLLASFSQNSAISFLAFSSMVFYASWSPLYTFLLLFSIIVNYTGGLLLSRIKQQSTKKSVFFCFITFDLGLLFYYKYIGFFLSNVNSVFGTTLPVLDIILPVGISFFTFTQLAFLVDVYKGYAKEYNFIHYVLFVTYFPHLVAGPILHHQQMMPQFSDKKTLKFDINNLVQGIVLFVIGLSKKVLIADKLGGISESVFDNTTKIIPNFFTAWKGSIAYTLQLYFDFSGYSDMAVALALMMGISLPLNFYSPYKARNIIEFWRRWHISLSQFLLHYLYIPLGGNRKGSFRKYCNLFSTMLLGGLWHGASWNFVIWGGLHGVYLIINHFFRMLKFPLWLQNIKGMSYLAWLLTFLCVVVAWVFFRASDLHSALSIIKGMFLLHGVGFSSDSVKEMITLLVPLMIALLMPNSMELLEKFNTLNENVNHAITSPSLIPIKLFSRLISIPHFYTLSVYGLGIGLGILACINILYLNKISYFIYSQF